MVKPFTDNGESGSSILPTTTNTRNNSKTIGDYAELKVAAYFASKGHFVSRPLTDNAPYDLIVDIDGKLLKVQVKSRKSRNGVLKIELVSMNNRYSRKYNKNDFDILVCHCIDNDEIIFLNWDILVEVENNLTIRLNNSKNNQNKKCKMFSEFKELKI